jgi:hypothetical protein
MTTKKPDASVLGQNIQPLNAESLAEAAGPQVEVGGDAQVVTPEALAAAIAYLQSQQASATVPAPQTKPHFRHIVLDPHEDIPAHGGLYVGYNGHQFLLPTNRPVRVPQGVVSVLDDAVLQVAVKDPNTLKYLTSRSAKRFQYRFTEDDPGPVKVTA